MIDLLILPPTLGGVGHPRYWGGQVLRDREVGKHLLALRHQHNAAARDFVRRAILDAPAGKRDGTLGHAGIVDAEKAGNGTQRGGLASTVGAEQGDDLALRPDRVTPCTAVMTRL